MHVPKRRCSLNSLRLGKLGMVYTRRELRHLAWVRAKRETYAPPYKIPPIIQIPTQTLSCSYIHKALIFAHPTYPSFLLYIQNPQHEFPIFSERYLFWYMWTTRVIRPEFLLHSHILDFRHQSVPIFLFRFSGDVKTVWISWIWGVLFRRCSCLSCILRVQIVLDL